MCIRDRKIAEFEELLRETSIQLLPQSDFKTPEAEESGLSFIENAILKARNASMHSQLPALGDDSGLEVAALNGAPGIYSARYSANEHGLGANDASNNQKLLAEMLGLPSAQRTARFVCALAFVRHPLDPTPVVVCGFWSGEILDSPRGENGFGYDPLFYLSEQQCTAAELPAPKKRELSHRGKAMQKLKTALLEEGVILSP